MQLVLVTSGTSDVDSLKAALYHEADAQSKIYGRKGLEGSIAEWTLLIVASSQGLVAIANCILRWQDRRKIKRIKYGDIEIENPTDEDIKRFREARDERSD
ncbi:hypothetical protein [Micromonospora sp. C95]|uniref:hypothetical protein n=1 Tax=Micromonospora sp. C95 TaxID=2824882 RepID=UPI001B3853F0|nr:hypothetical protein [Micromonospora sp. C95]MBQ1025828.1 hypothetical protein [Micromonospora sp. C95]